ncbi:hypothetical protein [Catellatospora tritici]|uniref:hypothetical protein n=1 Tax=Catellatospora tritici TaxID=2851566 RepID=UPI001C2DED0C|nr:hypothetical protein [Catellatospora tritici]MBV1850670.1 hypothetical protein [Catellatospora tritici]MBV1850923.1 hypothetical protein [Catellatospora tritici]
MSAVVASAALAGAWIIDRTGGSVPRFAFLLAPVAVWAAVIAYAQRVVVSQTSIAVYSMYRVSTVPRHMVAAGQLGSDGKLLVQTTDGRTVVIRTGPSWLWEPRSGRLDRRLGQREAAEQLNAMLRGTPALLDTATPRTATPRIAWRWGVVAIAAACLFAFAAGCLGPDLLHY